MNIEELTDLIDEVWNRYCPACCLATRCMKVDGGCRCVIQDYLKERLEEVNDNG